MRLLGRPGAVLVTGGAGYIGSHVVSVLLARGDSVVVVDDLSSGLRERIPDGVPLVEVDLAAPGATAVLTETLRSHGVEAVVHLAGRKQVAESVARPAWYYRQNVDGLLALHDAMSAAMVTRLVFSSSAAVYGDVRPGPDGRVCEDDPTTPISPYGQTKLAGEWLNRAAGEAWGLRAVNLRYFNVAGAASPELADRGAANLIPMVFERLARAESPLVFGADYPTSDGTCVRDFIDVRDLADAHVAALAYLDGEMAHGDVFNVGTGQGASVAEVVATVGRVTGIAVEPVVVDRRPGDPARVVAEVSRIAEALGWQARIGLDDMVASAWQGWRARQVSGQHVGLAVS
ncbi:UDP-glucose 4-epimerase GalE [Nocardioides sp.]|uniref:UDP-glucose 4-epimerase GalE n=1 Tax=Nocardioides sp. TaxID=35761 RepID=UPI0039E21487